MHKNQEFYIPNEILSEVILGLDWLMNNKLSIDTANMVLRFPDLSCQPQTIYDSSLKDPSVVMLSNDIVIPGRHEVIETAHVWNPTISESVVELNFDLVKEAL